MKMQTASAGAGVVALALSLALAGCSAKTETRSQTSTETTTSTSTSPTTTSAADSTPSAQASGANYTIADYIEDNGIVQTQVRRGDPGAPTLDLPIPDGWEDAGNRASKSAYGAIVSTDPAFAEDPPIIIAQLSKLTGDVDPAKILEFAPGELKNLPGYEPMSDGSASTLSGFDAYQFGATYKKDGVQRIVAQKTVVIPGQGGLYLLQLTAEGLEDQIGPLMEATDAIDEQTTITP